MPKHQNNTPYYLSLISGILIILGSTANFGYSPAYFGNSPYGYGYMGYMMRYMMGGYYGVMGYGMMGGLYYLPLLGVLSGIIVLYSSYLLTARPKEKNTSGLLILVFSALSFLSGGGFLVGGLLGIVGGLSVLSKK